MRVSPAVAPADTGVGGPGWGGDKRGRAVRAAAPGKKEPPIRGLKDGQRQVDEATACNDTRVAVSVTSRSSSLFRMRENTPSFTSKTPRNRHHRIRHAPTPTSRRTDRRR